MPVLSGAAGEEKEEEEEATSFNLIAGDRSEILEGWKVSLGGRVSLVVRLCASIPPLCAIAAGISILLVVAAVLLLLLVATLLKPTPPKEGGPDNTLLIDPVAVESDDGLLLGRGGDNSGPGDANPSPRSHTTPLEFPTFNLSLGG